MSKPTHELLITNSLNLERRREKWSERAWACYGIGVAELVAARTKRFQELNDPHKIAEFLEADTKFRDAAYSCIREYFWEKKILIESALELFVGSGTFHRLLMDWIPNLYGLDFVEDNLKFIELRYNVKPGRLFCLAAHELERGNYICDDGCLDAVFSFRSTIHQPFRERRITLQGAVRLLKPQGHLIVCEMFKGDVPEGREVNPGTWYWGLERSQKILRKHMTLVFLSDTIHNDGDPCRVAIFQKLVAPGGT